MQSGNFICPQIMTSGEEKVVKSLAQFIYGWLKQITNYS